LLRTYCEYEEYERPVLGIPTVVLVPFFPKFTLALFPPKETLLIPFLDTLSFTPGAILKLFLKLKPIIILLKNYLPVHLFLDWLTEPSLHINFPSAVQCLTPPLEPEHGWRPRPASAIEANPTERIKPRQIFLDIFLMILPPNY
jgi:hypothetical protein